MLKRGHIYNTVTLSSYWFKLASMNFVANDNLDIVLLINSVAPSSVYALVRINARYNSEKSITLEMRVIAGQLGSGARDLFRLYYEKVQGGRLELWADLGAQYGMMDVVVLSESIRKEIRKNLITLENGIVNEVQTPGLTDYITATV